MMRCNKKIEGKIDFPISYAAIDKILTTMSCLRI
jgi:hypothetical protein